MELNIYGEFTPGPWKNAREILAAINSNKDEFFPSKVELRQFASSGAGVVEGAVNVWNLFCAIVRHKPVRVNIFTHAISGYIALSGRVVKGNVYFAKDPDTELGSDTIEKAIEEGFSFSDSKTKDVTMNDVRDALGSHAQLIVYACHAGLSREYMQRIAKMLRVRVGGFTDEIRYYPQMSSDGRSLDWQFSVGSGKKVQDFHGLSPIFVSP